MAKVMQSDGIKLLCGWLPPAIPQAFAAIVSSTNGSDELLA